MNVWLLKSWLHLIQFPYLNEPSSYVVWMFVVVASLKEQLSSPDSALQRMDNEEPLVKTETVVLPTIKEEFVVSIGDVLLFDIFTFLLRCY